MLWREANKPHKSEDAILTLSLDGMSIWGLPDLTLPCLFGFPNTLVKRRARAGFEESTVLAKIPVTALAIA
jgi:hypothetical protein